MDTIKYGDKDYPEFAVAYHQLYINHCRDKWYEKNKHKDFYSLWLEIFGKKIKSKTVTKMKNNSSNYIKNKV
jgi:hypothetical protein